MTEPETDQAPTLLIGGTFAIYHTQEGALVLVTDVEGRGTERRKVPPALVKMMLTGRGPFAAMAKKMFDTPALDVS